jgi:GNAT superfamily N-acetyltransferase
MPGVSESSWLAPCRGPDRPEYYDSGHDAKPISRTIRCSTKPMSNLRISTNLAEFDIAMIHRFLTEESYWAKGLPRPLLERAIAHSLCFAGFIADAQVAFARVVTDRATFAHLKDVFVLQPFRGKGYGVALIKAIMSHPELEIVTMTLATKDAHELYVRFGFGPHPHPERQMVRFGSSLGL